MALGCAATMLALGFMAVLPNDALAQTATELITTGLTSTATGTYATDLTVSTFIGNIIRTILAATGIVFLVITVWAGVLYMTAAGEDTKIKKAKGMLTSSVIGLVIIVAAYATTNYVINAIAQAATQTSTSTPG
mgnify:CR=1 FL=1